MRRQIFSQRHHDVGRSLEGVASLDRRRGRYREARESVTEATQIFRETAADPDATSGWSFQDALLREAPGDLAGAECAMQQYVELLARKPQQGRDQEAVTVLEQGIAAFGYHPTTRDPERVEAESLLPRWGVGEVSVRGRERTYWPLGPLRPSWSEKMRFVSLCPELHVASQGPSLEEAHDEPGRSHCSSDRRPI